MPQTGASVTKTGSGWRRRGQKSGSRRISLKRSCQELRKDPLLDMNPADASDRGIGHEDWVWLETPRAKIRVKANLTETVLPGVVHIFHSIPEADVNLLIER